MHIVHTYSRRQTITFLMSAILYGGRIQISRRNIVKIAKRSGDAREIYK